MHALMKLATLATVNILIAMMLGVSFFGSHDAVQTLTEDNVSSFVRMFAAVEDGQQKNMDQYAVADWLSKHVADDGAFKSALRYQSDNDDKQEKDVAMDKKSYIASVLQSRSGMRHHESAVKIEYVKIAPDARSATAMITDQEEGVMTVPTGDESGSTAQVQVKGTSFCEQQLSLGDDHQIKVTGANCSTDMAVDGGG